MSIWQKINDVLEATNTLALELSNLQGQTDIQQCNGNFQRLVAYRILQTGKQPEQITLGELRAIVTAASNEYHEALHPIAQAI